MPVGDRDAVHRAWKLHFDDVTHSLVNGFYQGWDLHPAQLPTRYAAVYAFFLAARPAATARLRNFVEKAAQATLVGDVFDDAATGQGLLNFFVRGTELRRDHDRGGASDRADARGVPGAIVREDSRGAHEKARLKPRPTTVGCCQRSERAKTRRRVDLRRTQRRHERGHASGRGQCRRHRGERHRIGRRRFEEEALDRRAWPAPRLPRRAPRRSQSARPNRAPSSARPARAVRQTPCGRRFRPCGA